jgi:hypothetical protein
VNLRTAEQRPAELVARLMARASNLRQLLGVHVGRTRQLLAVMLSGPVLMLPVVENGQHGYRFSGRLRLGRLLRRTRNTSCSGGPNEMPTSLDSRPVYGISSARKR